MDSPTRAAVVPEKGYNQDVIDAPQQDWSAYESRARQSDAAWIRNLTPPERFALYDDLFRMVLAARSGAGDWPRLEAWRWREKLSHRLRSVEAFRQLDRLRRERSTSHHPC